MRYLPVFALLVFLVACGVNPNPANPDLTPIAKPNTTQTYDMLSWMTMSPTLSSGHHMAGTANPLYTTMTSSRMYWTKTQAGYPWDVQLFDKNFIYLWVTELAKGFASGGTK